MTKIVKDEKSIDGNKLILVISILFTILISFLLIQTNPQITIFGISINNIMIISSLFVVFFSFYINMKIFIQRYALPIPHSVAIIGFPRAGKTTLITSIFGEIFLGRVLKANATMKGSQTITRINESLEMLKKGLNLGPTQDQDRFSYRADITIKKFPYTRTYKVEFADFPGDNSEDYILKYGPWLHTSQFFKWTVESDAIILVVDLGHYLSPRDKQNFIAQTISALRAAWQHYLDYNESRIDEVRKHPLILTFTKADLFGEANSSINSKERENIIARLGFGKLTPPIIDINPEPLEQGQNEVMQDFDELIQYFKKEAPNFHVLFTSSFGLINGKRLGINELLLAVLPP